MQTPLKYRVAQQLREKTAVASASSMLLYWFLNLAYLEVLLHTAVFDLPAGGIFLALLFDFAFAGFLTLITLPISGRIRGVITILLTVLLILLYGSQVTYYFVFGSLYTVSQIQQGGAAITSFTKELLLVMKNNILRLLPLLIPAVVAITLSIRAKRFWKKTNALWWVILLIATMTFHGAAIACVGIGGTGYFSNAYVYNSNSATVDQLTQRFGLLTAFRLDIQGRGDFADTQKKDNYYVPAQTQPAQVETSPKETETKDQLQQEIDPLETQPMDVENPYNVLDIDFDLLNTMTKNETIREINNYCASLTGTSKNEYTGMLEDYNLIVLCAEAFFPGAIQEEITPTLYRLANEGFIFQNYYTTFPNNTTDGEYTLCMGLYPDMSRGKTIASFYASRNSYLPYCLGNAFSEQRGVASYGYHNYLGSYYGRDESHTNMGYTMKFAKDGMRFTSEWPSSDLEMMKQSVDDYINSGGQFHAYYMTFSGHLSYDRYNNPMVYRNWELVKHLPYSDEAKAYLSCNIELDKALEYLLQRLEEAGIADKTAIVLAADHHPYGLTDAQCSELIGENVVKLNKFKSSLIFWVGGLEEPIVVDEYCCTVDILPTILNLWGFEFDSRMLVGTDVFSDGIHVAVLKDKSFYTDKVWVDTEYGIIQYLVDPKELPSDYIDNMMRLIETKFSLSSDILNSAYYNFVFEKGEVAVTRYSWE